VDSSATPTRAAISFAGYGLSFEAILSPVRRT
jgi:hypothetical protein